MRTVLVVDDEGDIRRSVCGVLADEGLRVLEAEDGLQALRLIHQERPELVLLDVWMPELDGIQLLRQVRREARSPEVVMISGHGNIETAVQATKLGAFDFIEKPFSLDGLLKIVNRALEHHAAEARQAPAGDAPRPPRAAATTTPAAGETERRERTLGRSVVATGHGLHSGIKTGLVLQPLPPRSGIVFANLSADDRLPAHVDFVDSTGYATALRGNGVTAKTVEHLLATLHAYGVANCLVKVQGEVPIMDGSAADFCRLIETAGICDQNVSADEIAVQRRLAVGDEGGTGETIAIEPADELSIEYTLRYPEPVGEQHYRYVHRGAESFRDEIAPARTFGFVRDMQAMASMGLAKGGRLDNCILVDDDRIVNTTLRFPDEFVRHKILDIMGDLYLLGRPIRGAVVARFTGHSENVALVKLVRGAAGLA